MRFISQSEVTKLPQAQLVCEPGPSFLPHLLFKQNLR